MSAQNSKPVGVLSALLGLVGFSALAGVLVTAMVTPAIAVTSMTANNTVGVFEELPDYMTINQQSQRNTLWAMKGGVQVPFAQVYDQNREEVAWDEVSQFVKDAAVAGEDERFFEHGGVDLAGIARAALNNVTGNSTQGASTLSQQLVKNLLIQEALTKETEEERETLKAEAQSPTIDRKLKEAKLAIGLEKRYTKEEILLGYLNIAGFGGNTYGIQSAAQQYYSTNAKDLTAAQAASLMGIVQQPSLRRPDVPDNRENNQSRRDAILKNMYSQDMLTKEQYDEAIATPVDDTTVKISPPQNGCLYASGAKHFCDYVVRSVPELEALGTGPDERNAAWKKGGYDIYTTIDLDQQAHAELVVANQAPGDVSDFQLGAAVSTVEVGTGRIVIMAQNKGFDNSEAAGSSTTAVNFNTDRAYGQSSGFQVGSTYKLFTLVNWLQNGHGLREVVNGNVESYDSFPAKCLEGGRYVPGEGPYKPANFTRTNEGRVDILQATRSSINAAFIDMASGLDLCDIRDTAESMGVHRADGGDLQLNPGAILGTNEIAPLTMANAYATVANKGVRCQPIAVDKVVAPDGTELPGQSQDCTKAIEPEIAAAAAYALEGVMTNGTAIGSNPRDGTPLIGKTGTTDQSIQTWVAVASARTASAVWVGNIVGDMSFNRVTLASGPGTTARHRIMNPIQTALDASPLYATDVAFPEPPRELLFGQTQPVPNVVGQSIEQAKRLIERAGLVFRDGGTVESERPAGQVAQANPGTGAQVARGARVTVFVSDGSLSARVPDVVGQSEQDARGALSGQGYDDISVDYVEGAPEELCQVTASDPGGGTRTSDSVAVNLTVNGGELTPGETPDCS